MEDSNWEKKLNTQAFFLVLSETSSFNVWQSETVWILSMCTHMQAYKHGEHRGQEESINCFEHSRPMSLLTLAAVTNTTQRAAYSSRAVSRSWKLEGQTKFYQ